MHRITVVGSGFAALSAALGLPACGLRLEISVVSPRAERGFERRYLRQYRWTTAARRIYRCSVETSLAAGPTAWEWW